MACREGGSMGRAAKTDYSALPFIFFPPAALERRWDYPAAFIKDGAAPSFFNWKYVRLIYDADN